jgi:hypothetical protein
MAKAAVTIIKVAPLVEIGSLKSPHIGLCPASTMIAAFLCVSGTRKSATGRMDCSLQSDFIRVFPSYPYRRSNKRVISLLGIPSPPKRCYALRFSRACPLVSMGCGMSGSTGLRGQFSSLERQAFQEGGNPPEPVLTHADLHRRHPQRASCRTSW